MSKGLRHYSKAQVKGVVMRRLAAKTKGLGYWAAMDYMNKKDPETKKVIYEKMTEEDNKQYEETGTVSEAVA